MKVLTELLREHVVRVARAYTDRDEYVTVEDHADALPAPGGYWVQAYVFVPFANIPAHLVELAEAEATP